jgi:hypothetical protein
MSDGEHQSVPPEAVLRRVYEQAGGRCQCHMPHCDHARDCHRKLRFEDFGETWQALHLFPEQLEAATDPLAWMAFWADCAGRWQRLAQPVSAPPAALG